MSDDARIVRPAEAQPARVVGEERMTGHVELRSVTEALDIHTMRVNCVRFAPGARSRPHSHDADQVLYFVAGRGVVAVDGGPDQLVEVGEMVCLPANTIHMHGAAPGSAATHLSLMPVQHTNDFDGPCPPGWEHYRR